MAFKLILAAQDRWRAVNAPAWSRSSAPALRSSTAISSNEQRIKTRSRHPSKPPPEETRSTSIDYCSRRGRTREWGSTGDQDHAWYRSGHRVADLTESTIYLEDQYLAGSMAAGGMPAIAGRLGRAIAKPAFKKTSPVSLVNGCCDPACTDLPGIAAG
jgi:hypothetical protein